MWRRLKNTGWFFLFLMMGFLVSADFGENLEPIPEKMEERLKDLSQRIPLFVTLFEMMTDYPEESREAMAVFQALKSEYVNSVSDKTLLAGALSGMVGNLEPHSYYFHGQEFQDWKQFRSDKPNSTPSLGIELARIENGGLKIGHIVEGSPAYRVGLQRGDAITHLDGASIRWQQFSSVQRKMHNIAASGIRLTVFRKKEKRTFTVTVQREPIVWPQVHTQWLAPGLAWVHVSRFSPVAIQEFIQKINLLLQENPHPKGVVLDLRENPGGLVNSAVALASVFLPSNKIIMTLKGRSPYSYEILKTSHQNKLPSFLQTIPMVVLVNAGSASASEVIAGALQDHQRAVIMGSKTFGKGIMQTSFGSHALGGGFQFTSAHYYLPSGRSIQGVGVVPDILIEDSYEILPYAGLRKYESDYPSYLVNPKSGHQKNEDQKARQKAREQARIRWEEEERKPMIQRKLLRLFMPPLGYDDEYHDPQLLQAINHLKGLPVKQIEKPRP